MTVELSAYCCHCPTS